MFSKYIYFIALLLISWSMNAQENSATIFGWVYFGDQGLGGVNVAISSPSHYVITDENGMYQINGVALGKSILTFSAEGYKTQFLEIDVDSSLTDVASVKLIRDNTDLDDVVITGTLKAVKRMESAVPVEVYTPAFFRKNPTANIFDALQNVNGVRPQINCNVCNTGDIHINGLEGPYTLVLIDGMPIVSGLSTIYGLAGIPNSLLDRIEVVKGPASSLYGSEAVGGLINIITKSPGRSPQLSMDAFTTSWGEANVDAGFKFTAGKSAVMTGVNYFNYSNPVDNNDDNFTDVTLQHRLSLFQKWNINRNSNRLFTAAGRFFYEGRWGGDMRWNKRYRGGDDIYGESIYTKRCEILGAYELPVNEKILLSVSFADHDQNSVYGDVSFLARQQIGFLQLTLDKKVKQHDFLIGTALRYQFYNDNTPATVTSDETWIPGIFVQDEMQFGTSNTILLGARYDYNNRHGSIFTPRFAYKWKITENDLFRLNAGTGFRVVNLFTEEHAALTGSRDVIIQESLRPEKSFNINVNYLKKFYANNGTFMSFEFAGWYTYFTNSIIPDYDSNPNQIIYRNLDGYAITKGVSSNFEVAFIDGPRVNVGATFMDVAKIEDGISTRQILTEKFTGTWAVSYYLRHIFLDIDYTGNIYGPMRLPLLGPLDPRKAYSDVWSIQNIQFTFRKFNRVEIYAGLKNLLNWTPNKGNPFIIARADDPFDRNVQYSSDGTVIATPDNPFALTFDPGYTYGPNQGIRSFAGVRYTIP
jgi:outer membrane receptor for ferrienterochelin and colicins